MACKIAEDSSSIQPVIWPSTASALTPARMQTPPAALSPGGEQRSGAEPALNKDQLAQLEHARQAELAQCRQAAIEEDMKKGREAAANEIKVANDRLSQTLRDLVALKRRIRSEAEADVVKLSLAIAKRILHRELSADPESIQGVVHAGLQKLQNREIMRVRIPPSALDPVRSALEKASLLPAVSIVADAKLHNGDLIFETSLGELDASLETQLREIERGFTDRLGL